jgi:hypothetical protein
MRFRLVPFVLIAAIGLVVGGCGSEAADQGSGNALALVAGAAEQTSSVEASRVRLSAELSGSGTMDGTVLDMDVTASTDGESYEGSMTMAGMDIDTIAVDGTFYYGFPNLPDGVEWVEVTAADLEEFGIDLEAAKEQQQQANQALALLSESGEVEETGTETIDGTDTTTYRVVTDLVAVNEESGIVSGPLLDQMRGLFGDEVELDVWIDGDGYVRRIEYGVDLAESPDLPPGMPAQGNLDYRIEMSEFSDDFQPPAAPDPDTVIPMSEYAPGGG